MSVKVILRHVSAFSVLKMEAVVSNYQITRCNIIHTDVFAGPVRRYVELWGDILRAVPCYSHLITYCLLLPDTWCPVLLCAAPNTTILASRHGFIRSLEANSAAPYYNIIRFYYGPVFFFLFFFFFLIGVQSLYFNCCFLLV